MYAQPVLVLCLGHPEVEEILAEASPHDPALRPLARPFLAIWPQDLRPLIGFVVRHSGVFVNDLSQSIGCYVFPHHSTRADVVSPAPKCAVPDNDALVPLREVSVERGLSDLAFIVVEHHRIVLGLANGDSVDVRDGLIAHDYVKAVRLGAITEDTTRDPFAFRRSFPNQDLTDVTGLPISWRKPDSCMLHLVCHANVEHRCQARVLHAPVRTGAVHSPETGAGQGQPQEPRGRHQRIVAEVEEGLRDVQRQLQLLRLHEHAPVLRLLAREARHVLRPSEPERVRQQRAVQGTEQQQSHRSDDPGNLQQCARQVQ
mmetsp:Transcript_4944/g.14408  ORF Transcript_4944/g.14408 Transcript_4944/m.14408 type:complete len:315 (+) Transcript_4944:441-1385(+)